MTRLAERLTSRYEDARAGEAGGQLAAVEGGVGDPDEAGLAVGHLVASLPEGEDQAGALRGEELCAAGDLV